MSEPADKRNSARVAEQFRRLVLLTEAQAVTGWGIVLVLIALLGAIYLNQTSRIAAIGRRVQQLQFDLEAIKRENSTIERDIAEAQSLERLDAEAARLGFVRALPDDIEYLIVPEYPPMSDSGPTVATAPTPAPIETMGEALWLTLQGKVGDLMHGESP
jgi:hypothetical protein